MRRSWGTIHQNAGYEMAVKAPRGRRQQKTAFKRDLQAAGLWEKFVRARERLKSGGIEPARAWDLLAPVFWKKLAQVAAGKK